MAGCECLVTKPPNPSRFLAMISSQADTPTSPCTLPPPPLQSFYTIYLRRMQNILSYDNPSFPKACPTQPSSLHCFVPCLSPFVSAWATPSPLLSSAAFNMFKAPTTPWARAGRWWLSKHVWFLICSNKCLTWARNTIFSVLDLHLLCFLTFYHLLV